ncbi:MAG: DUF1566 domain-containing protein [Desulfomonilaceae bacterium]
MPDKITQVNHDVRLEAQADVGSLGKLKAGQVGVKTDVVAKNLFDKYPHADRIVVVGMMAATYCSMIRASKTLTDSEKLLLWSEFSERIFKFVDPDYIPTPTTSKSKDQSKPASKDSPAKGQNSRPSTRITPLQKTGDYYIDNVLEKISGGERNPNWSDGERSSALEGLVERAAFSCAATQESWPEMLWAVAATRIVVEDNIPAFGQHPETKNHLNKAAGVLLKMENDIASLWGDSFDPTAAMHNYFRNHDEFIHHLPGMVSTPDEDLQVRRKQNVNALRKALKGYIPIAADSSCEDIPPEPPTSSWTDPATGLTWAKRDNGQNVNWYDADGFCQNLNLGGLRWRLPDMKELETLYDESVNRGYTYHGPTYNTFKDGTTYHNHVKQGVEVASCCAWSREKDGPSNALYLRLWNGETWSFQADQSGAVRALCVSVVPSPPKITSSLNPADGPKGATFSITPSMPIESIDITVGMDLALRQIIQLSDVPNVQMLSPSGAPIMAVPIHTGGTSETILLSPSPNDSVMPKVRVYCPKLLAGQSLTIILGSLTQKPVTVGKDGQFQWPNNPWSLPQRNPAWIKITGTYETGVVDKPQRYPIDYKATLDSSGK